MSDDAFLARSLLTPRAVRERAHRMLALALDNGLDDLAVDLGRLDAVADYVIDTTRAAYPDLAVPPHSRWRHFTAGGFDRWGMIADVRGWTDAREAARAAADLAIVSVLLDAGAGAAWRFEEGVTGETFARSEGLAVASFAMIASGVLSADPGDPIRVDAEALENLSEEELAGAFQVSDDNPLAGLAGRVELMRNLGTVVDEAPDVFALADRARPGGIVDALVAKADDGRLPAAAILETVLAALGPIWPSRIELADVPLGDTWRHPALVTGDATTGLVPLHKLSQWLSYSLIEPLELAGLDVVDLDGLTGLAEYRNGGLMLDLGLVALKDPADLARVHTVDSPLVVGWRALTVALLDTVADRVRAKLGLDAVSLPLAAVLEGGTWAAGRRIAAALRPGGGPPLLIASDGTVF
ncbi:DUF1688 family protein [Rhizobiales bacterium Sp-1]|uniref:DUF1688 family protein n=1 Tax=Segnochrobactrum spirostomi TaxID=2608987 RepID=A0A6A7Y833_9HYPH|nr:DUF1688 family protein [Segnochrobactrum spirostomi]